MVNYETNFDFLVGMRTLNDWDLLGAPSGGPGEGPGVGPGVGPGDGPGPPVPPPSVTNDSVEKGTPHCW